MEGSKTDTGDIQRGDGGAERDSTADWLLPVEATPPLVGELEAKVDEAIVLARSSERAAQASRETAFASEQRARASEETARASERIARASEDAVRAIGAQVAEIGDRAADAAMQARRAADLAERASEAALTVARDPAPAAGQDPGGPDPAAGSLEDAWLRGFTERADRVMARLQAVERRLTPTRG